MSDADAGARAHAQEKFFNSEMLVCFAQDIVQERIIEVLEEQGYWKAVTVFQKLDFRRFGIVFSDPDLRDKLAVNGLDIDGVHITFGYHRHRSYFVRVLVSRLPAGVPDEDICSGLNCYGEILKVQQVTKVWYGIQVDTGDRVVVFKKIHTDIPSYVTIRGWKTFIRYRGQPKTCRSCGKVGHFAKDCPFKRKPDEKNQDNPEKKRKTDEKRTGDKDKPVNMEIIEPSVIPTHEELIKDLMETLTEIETDPVHSVQDKVREPSTSGTESATVQSVQSNSIETITVKVAGNLDSDVSSVPDSSITSEVKSLAAEAAAVSTEQTSVTGFQHRSFEQFLHDLHQITVEGKSSPEYQYIFDYEGKTAICACYLFWSLGDSYGAQETVSHVTAGNRAVMERWEHISNSGITRDRMEFHLKSHWEWGRPYGPTIDVKPLGAKDSLRGAGVQKRKKKKKKIIQD